MAETVVIATLRSKREEVAEAFERLERQAEHHRVNLAHLDATIGLFDPGAETAPTPGSKLRKRNEWFQAGECRRRIHDVLRDAAAAMTTRAIVEAVMAVKKLPAEDGRTRELIHKTVLGSLNRAGDTIERVEVAGSIAWRVI